MYQNRHREDEESEPEVNIAEQHYHTLLSHSQQLSVIKEIAKEGYEIPPAANIDEEYHNKDRQKGHEQVAHPYLTPQDPYGEAQGREMTHNTHKESVEVFQRFSFWAAVGTITFLLAIISLGFSSVISIGTVAAASIVLLAAAIVFLKVWYDLRS